MDLSFTPREEAFRREVRAFLAEHLSARLSAKVAAGEVLTKADVMEWHRILYRRGWLASHWPVQYGGTGWTPTEKYIFEQECALHCAPRLSASGLNLVGPVLVKYGSEAQKRHWLPRILDGTDWWCQGYSEPGAGSDLAAVKTSAVRRVDSAGSHYLVNGQKIWTTLGQHADMMFALVRTDPGAHKPQEGISFLLIDMKSPGIEVRPIVTLDGDHEVNEVFFSNVRVPAENLVGEENRGWTYAKYLLTYERTGVANVGISTAALARLKTLAAGRMKAGRPLLEDPAFAARVARVEIDLRNMATTNLRVLCAVEGGGAPGPESSMLKIRGSEIGQEITSLARRATGATARGFVPGEVCGLPADASIAAAAASRAAAVYFNFRKLSIYGGSNEIQKNIVAKTMLGL